ncbi:MAG TPA: cob(I)yrinic acid a,c-diamide adenosyltransferase [Acholeplasma sp.]|jgi:cob(I)alamin adenosyltransferase|nr:cob(I)yrinic acid a,c-diamide adenosyltransferase [Acholeplasma sp.]
MKVYTKRGDRGETDLFHERVKKSDLKMDVVGTLDELIAVLSFANAANTNEEIKEILTDIREDLSLIVPTLFGKKEPTLTNENVSELEILIDTYSLELEPLKSFVYFENNTKSSAINVARVVTRRLERHLVKVNEIEPLNEACLSYINRLSDLLFVLARYIEEKD